MEKTAKSKGGSVSTKAEVETNENEAVTDAKQALIVTGDGDVSGPLQLALSQQMQDQLMLELQDALHQVQEGFGELSKPRDLFAQEAVFDVVDAITISDFEDRRSGEVLTKHIFKLQFPDTRIALVMQSDARPRRILAQAFARARALGGRIVCGPYKFGQKTIPGQPEPAMIFVQQPGFEAKAV